jgi:hypothetical protein
MAIFTIYHVCVYNILGGRMQHHISLPKKIFHVVPRLVDSRPPSMNPARRSPVAVDTTTRYPFPLVPCLPRFQITRDIGSEADNAMAMVELGFVGLP